MNPDELNETKPLERKRYETMKSLMEKIAFGERHPDAISSVQPN